MFASDLGAMHRHFFSLRIAGIVVLAALALATVDLWWNGWNVVHDPDQRLTRAEFVYDDNSGAILDNFATGYWGGRARQPGRLRLVCASGATRFARSIVPREHATYTVSQQDCATQD